MSGWLDLDRTLSEMEAFRRQFDAAYDAYDGSRRSQFVGWSAYPEGELRDVGDELVLTAELPGIPSDAIDLQVTAMAMTISGERDTTAPEGYTPHRQERRAYRFSRSFRFPVKVDSERAAAELKDGVLTVHLPKAAEAQPKRIQIGSTKGA
jgi:HSP20 family protein